MVLTRSATKAIAAKKALECQSTTSSPLQTPSKPATNITVTANTVTANTSTPNTVTANTVTANTAKPMIPWSIIFADVLVALALTYLMPNVVNTLISFGVWFFIAYAMRQRLPKYDLMMMIVLLGEDIFGKGEETCGNEV